MASVGGLRALLLTTRIRQRAWVPAEADTCRRILQGSDLWVASVGDSRALLLTTRSRQGAWVPSTRHSRGSKVHQQLLGLQHSPYETEASLGTASIDSGTEARHPLTCPELIIAPRYTSSCSARSTAPTRPRPLWALPRSTLASRHASFPPSFDAAASVDCPGTMYQRWS